MAIDFIAAIGVVQNILAIAQAIGLNRGIVADQSKKMLDKLDKVDSSLREMNENFISEFAQVKNRVTQGTVVGVRSHLRNIRNLPSNKVNLLIRLLLYLQETAPNVIFIVFVKCRNGKTLAKQGFDGYSSDRLEDIVMRIDSFFGTISRTSASITAYTDIRIRGIYDPDIESFCTAILINIITDVCGLSRDVEFGNKMTCKITAKGNKTIALLKPVEYRDDREDCDSLCRVFLLGNTRSGKSTVGNALAQKQKFMISDGMTSTMRVERSERVENIDKEKWVTEIYDTPGLSDKHGFFYWYQSAIEDQIATTQKVSSYIITVSVDAEITGSLRKSLKSYKKLFGSSMDSRMIVVLTTRKTATRRELQQYLELNSSHILRLANISKESVHCVSLRDLREYDKSASHDVVRKIAQKSRDMPMKVVEAFEKEYKELGKALSRKSNEFTKRFKKILGKEWPSFENIIDQFENKECTAMTEEGDRMNGFVMSNSTKKNVAMKAVTLGVVDRVRKVAVHISPRGKKAKCAWQKFRKENRTKRHNSDLMRKFANELCTSGLGVIVKDVPIQRYDILRVKSYEVTIIDPVGLAREELAAYAQKKFQNGPQELSPELIDELTKKSIPSSIRCQTCRRLRQRK